MVATDIAAAASQVGTANLGALTAGSYLRVVAATIVIYDYLVTLPSEYRLHKTTNRRSLGYILFILIRYSSMILIIVNMIGYFYNHFSPTVCSRYIYVSTIFKVLQVMESQAIMALRTYNIAQRNVQIRRTLFVTYIVVTAYEWFSNMRNRIPVMTNGNCTVGSLSPDNVMSAWSFFVAAMLFDILVMSISTYHLLKARAVAGSTASKLVKILLYDGLIYFIALTAVNVMNTILYRRGNEYQKIGATLGFAVISIMSQRIVLHAREARAQQLAGAVIISPPSTWNPAASPVCSDGQTKAETSTSENLTGDLRWGSNYPPSKVDVEVHIDKSTIGDSRQPDVESIDRDHYATPRSLWDRAQDNQV